MRFYTITNLYLSDIQRGIQSAHCLHELYEKYIAEDDDYMLSVISNWANNHKTMIVLNGGYSENLNQINLDLIKADRFPHACFNEPGIGNALTCVGVIADDELMECITYVRENQIRDESQFMYQVDLISNPDENFLYHVRNASYNTITIAVTLANLPLA